MDVGKIKELSKYTAKLSAKLRQFSRVTKKIKPVGPIRLQLNEDGSE